MLFDRIVTVFSILLNLCLIVISDIIGEILTHVFDIRMGKIHEE